VSKFHENQHHNNYSKTYRPDNVKITSKVLKRIPEKYLVDLSEFRFQDKSNGPIRRRIG
jgi:hypothetical protein